MLAMWATYGHRSRRSRPSSSGMACKQWILSFSTIYDHQLSPLKGFKLTARLQAVDIGVLDDLRPSFSPLKALKLRHGLQAVDIGVLDGLRPSFSPPKAFR